MPERKRKANRENAKKSTSPKTARGKRNSSFNAVKHGLLVQRLASAIVKFDESESQLERLSQLVTGLYEKYGNDGDVHTELLIELAAVDYWRHARSLDFETVSLADPRTLVRYNTANRRALLKTLDMLEEVRREKVGGESSHVEPAGSGAPESVARRPRPRARVQQIAPCSTIFRQRPPKVRLIPQAVNAVDGRPVPQRVG